MVLVNAKDKARNVVLTPPSLPPIFSLLNTGMGQTPPFITECITMKVKKIQTILPIPSEIEIFTGSKNVMNSNFR